jgi:hypothetical protein
MFQTSSNSAMPQLHLTAFVKILILLLFAFIKLSSSLLGMTLQQRTLYVLLLLFISSPDKNALH